MGVEALFKPLDALQLEHRIVLAPLTRNRATEPNLCPHGSHVAYYSQRASPGGLLITEGTTMSPEAVGYPSVPGIWTEEQADAWRRVTDAVHAKGAKIFCQLWHVGRVANRSFGEHPLLRKSGLPRPGVSSSAEGMVHPKTKALLKTMTYKGVEDHETPRELSAAEMPRLCGDYAHAARMALRAGFDGVELHAAHGYLIDQFINDGVNKRTDQYGGTIENRCRLLGEVVHALVAVMGPGRVGVRLSPTTLDPKTGRQNQAYFAATCSDPDEVYAFAVTSLNAFPLAYLNLSEPRWSGRQDGDPEKDTGFGAALSNAKYRKLFNGTLMSAGGFTPAAAAQAIADGTYDLIAFGRWFISNPDLPERIRAGVALNVYNRETFYTDTFRGGGDEGYTDYPSLDGAVGMPGKYRTLDQAKIGLTLASAKL